MPVFVEQAFRTGVVDLPENAAVAKVTAITLPEQVPPIACFASLSRLISCSVIRIYTSWNWRWTTSLIWKTQPPLTTVSRRVVFFSLGQLVVAVVDFHKARRREITMADDALGDIEQPLADDMEGFPGQPLAAVFFRQF